MNKIAYFITLNGIVQGVGMRPFLLRTAQKHNLCGYVCNSGNGVECRIEGDRTECLDFISEIEKNPPVTSHITRIDCKEVPFSGAVGFDIHVSEQGRAETYISPDIGVCDKCIEEINNPENVRYNYAFTNCTDCGPRFSIIDHIPYDRKNTSMEEFEMCSFCRSQYENVHDRRFHAQPIACPECGPRLNFLGKDGVSENPVDAFVSYINDGKIVAVKGVGGYHLACDAFNEDAVSRLRKIKGRYLKPFAVMCRDMTAVKELCRVDADEEHLLNGSEKPIVLLNKTAECSVSPSVAPKRKQLGVMLPYTPLHVMIMCNFRALVMTSANFSDEPMIYTDDYEKLFGLCDGVLTHNRKIRRRVDDSVMFVANGKPRFIRRARGFTPFPVSVNGKGKQILCTGAQQKNTFCLVKDSMAFIGTHMGDLDYDDNASEYEREIKSFTAIFDGVPEAIVCDMHPDYFTSGYAASSGFPIIKIQHHHAHFAACLADNGVTDEACLGFIFDGTGYGTDGTVWGGEVLLGNCGKSERIANIKPFRLPGNEAAVRDGRRVAAYLMGKAGCVDRLSILAFPEAHNCISAAEAGVNSPLCSSMGRLFDAVAAMAGVVGMSSYEGQGAEELEQVADMTCEGAYEFDVISGGEKYLFDTDRLVRDIVVDISAGIDAGTVSARFHRAVINLVVSFAQTVRKEKNINSVAISGGCFQNIILLTECENQLKKNGFTVCTCNRLPSNDGGISYGQAAAAEV